MKRRWVVPIFGWGLLVGFFFRPVLDHFERLAGYIAPARPTGRLHP